MYKTLKLEFDKGLACVYLNRPKKHNAINMDMFKELGILGESLRANKELRAIILTGVGKSFCAGIDLSEMGKLTQNGSFNELALKRLPGSDSNLFQKAATIWFDMPVPVIAAISGICFGGGMQICLGADIRLASPETRFSIMELKWGIIPDMGISITLPRLLSYDKAMELTMSNREFLADEAHSLGIITKISENPLIEGKVLAESILKKSPDAIIQLKKLYKVAWSSNTAELLKKEAELQTTLMGGENQMESIASNFGLRDPVFKNVNPSIRSVSK